MLGQVLQMSALRLVQELLLELAPTSVSLQMMDPEWELLPV